MAPTDNPSQALAKLGDTGQTIANPDEDVRGRAVRSAGGEDLGKVADLLVDDQEHRVRFLAVSHGGVLGIGASESFIPVEAIVAITPDEVRVDTDREHLSGAPRYDPEVGDRAGFYESVYGYYGFPPFWAPGYTAPRFPYFPFPPDS